MLFNDQLQTWENPLPDDLAADFAGFLNQLGGPTALLIQGKDPSRTRAITTLLHGNEPSGAKAIYQWLKSGKRPQVNALLCILSVQTALTPPLFSHRHLPNIRDLNRCFRAPFSDPAGALAARLLDLLRQHQPEAVIDIHNTSGSGPAFGVATCLDEQHKALLRPFGNQLVVTDLRLGALMELGESDFPTLTIECGGPSDPEADLLALNGIERYLSIEDPFSLEQPEIELYYHPLRLELTPDARVCFSDQPQLQVDITLPIHADRMNRRIIYPEQPIAWLGPNGLASLSARDAFGRNRIDDFFVSHNHQLFGREPLKFFMVTTNPEIAQSDCLFYFVKVDVSDP